jgi:hypothetical protein
VSVILFHILENCMSLCWSVLFCMIFFAHLVVFFFQVPCFFPFKRETFKFCVGVSPKNYRLRISMGQCIKLHDSGQLILLYKSESSQHPFPRSLVHFNFDFT